jgi:hypothetical protein
VRGSVIEFLGLGGAPLSVTNGPPGEQDGRCHSFDAAYGVGV